MKKYAVVGVSNRAIKMFIEPLLKVFSKTCQLVGLVDPDPLRFTVCATRVPEARDIPGFSDSEFDGMMADVKPDVVIVAGRDFTHADYIIRALEKNVDVIVEKPMVTTSEDCRRVLEAEKKSRAAVMVTQNTRYTESHRKIKELILEGRVGRITSADLNWYVDTFHGSSYFKRWNRMRKYSGGLSIHKSCHHLDLMNWLIGQKPAEAFAFSALNYYGADGERNPERKDGRQCGTCPVKENCRYVMYWTTRGREVMPPDDHLESLMSGRARGQYTNYSPDACIYDSEIDIEDTYVASIRYDEGAFLGYTVNFSAPYEGYRMAINGTRGRIETMNYHSPGRVPFAVPEQTITYIPLFGGKEVIHPIQKEGAHGGADPILQEDLFLGPDPNRSYPILAGAEAGSYAVALGEAIWRSGKEGRPVTLSELLG